MRRARSRVSALLPLLLLGLAAPAPEPARWAVLVGIDDYQNYGPDDGDLRGAENDARAVREVLVERWGLSPDRARLLLSGDATREAIREAIVEWAGTRMAPGDYLLFFFAGHGSQVLDDDGDEEDGLDETICPVDVLRNSSRGDIRDDELSEWISSLPSSNVIVILDSCNSGTATRLAGELQPRFLPRDPPRPPVRTRSLTGEEVDELITDMPEGIVEIAAAAPGQSAMEGSFGHTDPEGPHRSGAFTHHLVEQLWQAPPDATYDELFRRVVNRMRAGHFTQDPQFSGPPDGSLFGTSGSGVGLATLVSAEDPVVLPPPAELLPPPAEILPAPEPPSPGEEDEPVLAEMPEEVSVSLEELQPVLPPSVLRVSGVVGDTVMLSGGAMAGVTVGSLYEASGGAQLEVFRVDAGRAATEVVSGTVRPGEVVLPSRLSLARPDLKVTSIDLPPAVEREVEEILDRLPDVVQVPRGEWSPDLYLVPADGGGIEILGRDGGARHLLPAGGILAEVLPDILHKELAFKRLAALENPASPYRVDLVLADGTDTFTIGDEIFFEIRSERGGHLLLVDLGMDGTVTVLHPNPWENLDPLPSGEWARLPSQAVFQISPPAGVGMVRAIVTPAPLRLTVPTGEGLRGAEALRAVEEIREQLVTNFRNITVGPGGSGAWATGSVVYRVRD